MQPNSPEPKSRTGRSFGLALALGVGVGTAVGVATHQIAIGVAIGAGIGAAIAAAFEAMTVAEAIRRLQDHDVPVGPVLSLDDLPHHEQVEHNGIIIDWQHPDAGPLRQAGPAARFSATPTEPRLRVPLHGEDTDEVLRTAGLTAEDDHPGDGAD